MSRQASGLMAWVIQRATSLYLALFLSYLLIHFTLQAPSDHAALVAWATHPLVALGLVLFVPVLLAHAWIGIRDVLIDYVHSLGPRIGLLTLFAFVFIASGLWAYKAIVTAGLQG
ncbi:succinate dehydrogenase, hydrophobic membrane anchor protein [Thiocapsa imhoffii]|uniref:Succinate dehydrogenase hydrophobic membrane anchor subunit n=1 Tax=Thiocapsa imhoffii TaxID=382777 RepID=A0A9X0WGZ8_9GAMM|nr:succinate dehydrogenase, hydrophobic membrane anchor protein [Thiocapsa imhoffii]MBK1644415.1 succinate dehydrogenase, hydrophobic membrane anchor protein [Thiocapsa imhoffii]